MYGIFMESWVILKNYGGTGFLLLLYVIALGYLLICEKNKYVRSIFVYAPMLLIFGFMFPVSRKLYVAVLNEGNTYYRVLWLLPVSITLAYTECSVIYRLGKRFEKYARWISYAGALVGVAVIMLAGEYVYNSPHISKAENAYHLPQEVIDICDTAKIENMSFVIYGNPRYISLLDPEVNWVVKAGDSVGGVKLNYSYGIQTKIKVLKNHLDAPHNVCYEGSIIATDTGFVGLDELDRYKKEHISVILKQLNELAEGNFEVNESDVNFTEVEDEEVN